MSTAPSIASASGNSAQEKINMGYLLPVCLAATLGGLLFGYDTGVISGAIEPLTAKFSLTPERGGKPLMLVGSAGMFVALIAMGLIAQLSHDLAQIGSWMLAPIILYIACFGLSVGPVVWVILAEIYPTAVRGRALGLAICALWLADFAVTQAFPMMDGNPWLVDHFRHAFPFYVYGFFCLVLIGIMKFVPETKGKSLEQIERMWREHHGKSDRLVNLDPASDQPSG